MTGHEDDHEEPIGIGGVLQNWSDLSGEKQAADIGSIGEIEPLDVHGHEPAEESSTKDDDDKEIETGGQLEQAPQFDAPIDTEPMPETRGPWNRGDEG
ncbi:MAG TPA: hypothetical protein VIP07_06370 [Candidatus Limnocylindria bacterium]